MRAVFNHLFHSRRVLLCLLFVVILIVVYFLFFRTVTISPLTEARSMQRLEATKQITNLQPFVSDGCSANISQSWRVGVQQLSNYSESFADAYADTVTIPFERACIEHDRAYHLGNGGYSGRLEADNRLRSAIISYGITNTESIQSRTNLSTQEEAIYLYEVLAEAVYRGVRLGGAPCTGQAYAWGFGYENGNCVNSESD